MPSKQSKQPDSAIITTTIAIRKGTWKEFQVAAIRADLTLRDAVREALADWVQKRKKAPTP